MAGTKAVNAGAVIVAGGKGKRFGKGTPKQFLKLKGRPVFLWSVDAFKKTGLFSQIILVVPEGYERQLKNMADRSGFLVVTGGRERFDSVKNGIAALDPGINYVSIHDAARPLIEPADIKRSLSEAVKYKASIVAKPAVDTIKLTNGRPFISSTYPRNKVWQAQTPQVFNRALIEKAYSKLGRIYVTDDSEAVERLGIKVKLVESASSNIKITHRQDIKTAETLLKERS